MARLDVITERISKEYKYYDTLWANYENITAEWQELETRLQISPDDSSTNKLAELYSQRCSLMYKIEHMHSLLERLMTEADQEEELMQDHAARIKSLQPARQQTERTLTDIQRKQKIQEQGASAMSDEIPAIPAGLSMKSTHALNILSTQGLNYGPDIHRASDTEATSTNLDNEPGPGLQAYKMFLINYNVRLHKEKAIQDMYDKAILEAEQKKERAFERLAATIKEINSEQSIRSQRRIDAEEKETIQRMKEIEAFRAKVVANIEQGIVTTDNIYKTFREEDQKRILNSYIKARNKHLSQMKQIAEEFAMEMARRELRYHKNLINSKKQAAEKAKSIATNSRNVDFIKRVTGLEDPYEVLYQSTRPKHLRDPSSVVAKNVIPQTVGLGLPSHPSRKQLDITHFKEYSIEEQKQLEKSIILNNTTNMHSPSRADPMSYLYKESFYDILPKGDLPKAQVSRPDSTLLANTISSASKKQRSSPPTQPPSKAQIKAKSTEAKKDSKPVDLDDWPSSDDENEVALAYDNVPPAPSETLISTKSLKSDVPRLPVARSVMLGNQRGAFTSTKMTPTTLAKIDSSTSLYPNTLDKSMPSHIQAFASHPPAVIFFDYEPNKAQSCIVQITNISAELAAFKIAEPEPLVLHLFTFKYVPGGAMSSGKKVPITITFCPPSNEKECIHIIDTFLTIKYQSGELRVPITCYPRQMAVLLSKSLELARKVYTSTTTVRHLPPVALAAQAKALHDDLNGTLATTLGPTTLSSMGPSCLTLNKDGNKVLITMSTAPHGKTEQSFYLLNSGALPAKATFRLDACALHNSLLGMQISNQKEKVTLNKADEIGNHNMSVYSLSQLSSSSRCHDRKISLDFGSYSPNPSVGRCSSRSHQPRSPNKVPVSAFRMPNVPIDVVYSYMQTATRSTSPSIPSKLHSTEEVVERRQKINEYDNALAKRIQEILATNNSTPINPPVNAKTQSKSRQPSPKAGASMQKQAKQLEQEPATIHTITEDEALDMALNELGPKPEELDSELMNEALSCVHLIGNHESEGGTPLLRISTPHLVMSNGNTFNAKKFVEQERKEKLKELIQENIKLITTQLEEERAAFNEVQNSEHAVSQKSKNTALEASATKQKSREPNTKLKKDFQDLSKQPQPSEIQEDVSADTLLNPEFFKVELDKRVKAKVEQEIAQWEKNYSILTDYLKYKEHSNIQFSMVLPPESIIALPIIHTPILFQTDILLKIDLHLIPIFIYLDETDDDYKALQLEKKITNTLLINAYTLPSNVYAISNSLDYLTCFYNSTYSSQIQLHSNDSNSKPITVFIPTLMRQICTSNISESIICKSTGDLFIKISLFCGNKSILMKILNQVESYQNYVDYTDIERTISKRERPSTEQCPLESWADVSISAMDLYPATLPSIKLGDDVRDLTEKLREATAELDKLLESRQELETRLKSLLQEKQTMEETLQSTSNTSSKPSSGLGTRKDKDDGKTADKKTAPSKGKSVPIMPTREDVQRLTLECDQLSSKLNDLDERSLPLLQGRIANAKAKLRNFSSVGGYVTCSFNILIRVTGQPEPIFVRINACFTNSELFIRLPYTHPLAKADNMTVHNKATVLSQVTKTMRTVGTIMTKTNRTRTENYLSLNDNLDLQDRSSINLGQIALWHITNVPVCVRNTSALPQHVALITKHVPDISLVAGPDNGLVLLYPGQEVRMHLGILPQVAKKFQVKCSVESEFGYIKNFTICATAMQPALLCQSSLEVFRLSIADCLYIDQIYLRSTVNVPKKWSVSPAFLKFMSENFKGLLNIKPTAGSVDAHSIYRLSVTVSTSPASVLRLISFLDDQHADEKFGDPFDPQAPAISKSDNITNKEEQVLGISSDTDIVNYSTKKNQFLFVHRRHLDPGILLTNENSTLSSSESSEEDTHIEQSNNENSKADLKKVKLPPFIDQYITINIPILTEETDSLFIICPLNLLITRPLITVSVIPNEHCDGTDVVPDNISIAQSLSFDDDVKVDEPSQSIPGTRSDERALSTPSKGSRFDDITSNMPTLSQSVYVLNLLQTEQLRLPSLMEKNKSSVIIDFGCVPLGCTINRWATISINNTLSESELDSYYGDSFRFKRKFEEAFDSDIVMTSCLEEAIMTPDKPIVLQFQYSPRRVGYTEEVIELASSSTVTHRRFNNVILKLKGYGVKATLGAALEQSDILVQTNFTLPQIPNLSSTDILYTEAPPILITDTSGAYTHTLSLSLINDQKYSFKYTIQHHSNDSSIIQSAAISEGVVPHESRVSNKLFFEIADVTGANGKLAATEVISGDAKKLILCRFFASRYPAEIYFEGSTVNVSLQGTTSIYCGCTAEQGRADFKHMFTSSQLADLVISPINGTVQSGKMMAITLSMPKLTFSGLLSIVMEGYISFKLSCGSQDRIVVLPVKVSLN